MTQDMKCPSCGVINVVRIIPLRERERDTNECKACGAVIEETNCSANYVVIDTKPPLKREKVR